MVKITIEYEDGTKARFDVAAAPTDIHITEEYEQIPVMDGLECVDIIRGGHDTLRIAAFGRLCRVDGPAPVGGA